VFGWEILTELNGTDLPLTFTLVFFLIRKIFVAFDCQPQRHSIAFWSNMNNGYDLVIGFSSD
jgi:hypothetical protein